MVIIFKICNKITGSCTICRAGYFGIDCLTENPTLVSVHVFQDILSISFNALQRSPTYYVNNTVEYRLQGTERWHTMNDDTRTRRRRTMTISNDFPMEANSIYDIRMFALLTHIVDGTIVLGDHSSVLTLTTGCGLFLAAQC